MSQTSLVIYQVIGCLPMILQNLKTAFHLILTLSKKCIILNPSAKKSAKYVTWTHKLKKSCIQAEQMHIKITCVLQLHVTWALPSILDLYRSKPYKYVSWIIEHKGNNSLASYLRKKMWGFDVFCGYCDNDNGFGYNSMYVLFEITVELTHEGIKHQQDVLDAIFSFINLVKKTGPQENTYNEIYKIGKNNFR